MQRPEPHVTDALGQTQLRSTLEPRGWTLTAVVDYGIDFDVEVFRDGRSTGITFKIQLKSSRSPGYSKAGDFISESIAVKNVRYLIDMQTPTVIVVADVETHQTFWFAPQNDPGLIKALADKANDESITVRVPTENVLPATADVLLESVGRAQLVLAARRVNTAPIVDFVDALRNRDDVEATIRAFKSKTAALSVQHAYSLLLQRHLDRAEALIRSVWEDREAPLETKLSAALVWEQVEVHLAIDAKTSDLERIRIGFRTVDRLRSLTRGGPPHLKFYTVLLRKVVELELILHRSWGAFLNIYLTKHNGGDPLWISTMLSAWDEYARRVDQKLRQCFRLIDLAVASKHGWAVSDPVLRLAKTMVLLAGQLKWQGAEEGEARSLEQAFQLVRLAASLARSVGDEDRFATAVGAARLISGDPNSASLQWMTEQIATITDRAIKAAAEDYIDRLNRREKGEEMSFEIETSERQIYENMAAGAGVDLLDPNDPIAGIIRIGLKDLNPERVLRNCEHIFITLGPAGLVAGWLQLPTAGSKTLRCTKHGYGVGSLSLDAAYYALREHHCAACPDAAPRAANWRYSHEWQRAENLKHADIADPFSTRPSKKTNVIAFLTARLLRAALTAGRECRSQA
jgi:hypothetical protein